MAAPAASPSISGRVSPAAAPVMSAGGSAASVPSLVRRTRLRLRRRSSSRAVAVRDGVDPRDRVGAQHVARARLVHLQERLLQQILGRGLLADETPQIPQDARRQQTVEFVERSLLAGAIPAS